MTSFKPHRQSEEGFVLVSAIWLLLLGAAVVVVIQLTVFNRAQSIAFDREQLERRLALETAYETAVADLLFNGPRSSFAQLPAKSNYNLNGKAITVLVVSESGKLDINRADPGLIDRALMGLGVDSSTRAAFLGTIAATRIKGANIATMPELEAAWQEAGLNSIVGRNNSFCAAKYLTVYSGLSRPQSGQMMPELARAIGESHQTADAGVQFGSAMRITIATAEGHPLIVVIRITGRLDNAIDVLDWHRGSDCATT